MSGKAIGSTISGCRWAYVGLNAAIAPPDRHANVKGKYSRGILKIIFLLRVCIERRLTYFVQVVVIFDPQCPYLTKT